jgi:hypothetical protein
MFHQADELQKGVDPIFNSCGNTPPLLSDLAVFNAADVKHAMFHGFVPIGGVGVIRRHARMTRSSEEVMDKVLMRGPA